MAGPQSTKFAAFQFYPGDFLSSSKVRRMSLAEVGVYITLLCFQWLDGSVPSDMPTLARMLRIPVKQLEKMWTGGPLPDCFTVRGTRMTNARLERTRKALTEYVEHQREQGRKGGLAKARNSVATKSPEIKASERLATGVANPSSSSLSLSSSSISSSKEKTTTSSSLSRGLLKPHGNVAFDSPRVWVPWKLHLELVGLRNNPNAEAELQTFYQQTSEAWTTGAHAGDNVDPEMFNFWRARYAEQWPAAPTTHPPRDTRPAWLQKAPVA